jgi:hypothetical protein
VTFQPIVKKNHTAVDCQGGDCDMLYRRNTTLIIISSMIKIITMGGRATPNRSILFRVMFSGGIVKGGTPLPIRNTN